MNLHETLVKYIHILTDLTSQEEKSFCVFAYIFTYLFTFLRVCLHFCMFFYIFRRVNHKALILHVTLWWICS